jgi:hypothetical protein
VDTGASGSPSLEKTPSQRRTETSQQVKDSRRLSWRPSRTIDKGLVFVHNSFSTN